MIQVFADDRIEDHLKNASYSGLYGEQLSAKLKADFEAFLRARAKLVHAAVIALAEGKAITVESLHRMSNVADKPYMIRPLFTRTRHVCL